MPHRIGIPPRDQSAFVRVPGNSEKPSSKKGAGVFHERHTSAQDPLYQEWIQEQTRLTISFEDGTALQGRLVAYDTYALQIETAPKDYVLVFKQSLRWIAPRVDDAASSGTAPASSPMASSASTP